MRGGVREIWDFRAGGRRGQLKGNKMKTVVKWFIKRYLTNKALKEGVHRMNAQFAEKVKVEGKEKVIGIANDVSEVVGARLSAFANDGKIDATELAQVNAADDAAIDKYFSDEKIGEWIDRILG